MHLLKLLIAGIWEFAAFYTFCFLSASLPVLAHCCPSTAVIKTRDSQVNRPEQDRSKQCLNIQHSRDHSGTGTDTPICFCPGQLLADFRTEQCLDSSLLKRFSCSHNTHQQSSLVEHEGSRQQFPQEHRNGKLIMGLQKFFEHKKTLKLICKILLHLYTWKKQRTL